MSKDKIITKLQIGSKAADEARQTAKLSELMAHKPEDIIENLIDEKEHEGKKRKLRIEIIVFVVTIAMVWLVWSQIRNGVYIALITTIGCSIGLTIRLIRYRRLL